MPISAVPRRDVVADAVSRLVAGLAWFGTLPQLHAAIVASSTAAERQDRAWPRSAEDLATGLRSHTDALRAHGLRMSIMPLDILIERIEIGTKGGPAAPGTSSAAAAVRTTARSRPPTLSAAA